MNSSSNDSYNKAKLEADENASRLFDATVTRDEKDIAAIRDRKGQNEPLNVGKHEDGSMGSSSGSSLEKKDSLEKEEDSDLEDKKADDKKTDNKSSGSSKAKSALESATGLASLKKKWAKLVLQTKILLIALAIGAVLFLGAFIFLSISTAFESLLNAISNFFGISEVDSFFGSGDGLLTNSKYIYDENGNEIDHKTLIKMLNDNQGCTYTIVDDFMDFIRGDDFGGDRCSFLRFVNKESSAHKVDTALIISTIFYGYDTQPDKSAYNSASSIPSDRVESSNHFEMLTQILTENKDINKDTVREIIENSYIKKHKVYFDWTVTIDDEGNKKGTCVRKTTPDEDEYSLDRWKIFMRLGGSASEEYAEYVNSEYSSGSSSDECKGSKSDDELLEIVKNTTNSDGEVDPDVNSSVDTADMREFLKPKQVEYDFTCVADINSKEKDNCGKYDYSEGFANNHFLGYRNPDNLELLAYDDIFTPKMIETTIQEIISKKKDINDVLLIRDPDADYSEGSSRIGPVEVGAYCKDYIKTPLDSIMVELRDCHSKYMATVSFEDYIIGVANAEVSNKNDNYVLSEMVAAISYALRRNNNYTKGNTIVMRSGTCDQAYCSPKEGCTVKSDPDICKGCMSFYIGGSRGKNGVYNKYKGLYEIASQFLVISNGKVHNAHYYSAIQNQWYKKASEGMAFTQIIQETYSKEGAKLVKCDSGDVGEETQTTQTPSTDRVGNKPTKDYPNVSADKGKFYGYAYKNGTDNEIIINSAWEDANINKEKYPNCSDERFASMRFEINVAAEDNFNTAFDNICTLLTKGVRLEDGTVCKYTMDDLQGGTVYLKKQFVGGFDDFHSYGIAQDWNFNKKYTISGKTYSPYSSNATMEDYWDFVEAINREAGKKDLYNEENCKNVNYILYKYAYESAGFDWGYGHLGKLDDNDKYISGSFNGKTFVVKY